MLFEWLKINFLRAESTKSVVARGTGSNMVNIRKKDKLLFILKRMASVYVRGGSEVSSVNKEVIKNKMHPDRVRMKNLIIGNPDSYKQIKKKVVYKI